MRQDHTIVRDRNSRVLTDTDAVHHLTWIEHTAAAVDDKVEVLEVIREGIAGSPLEMEVLSCRPPKEET